MKKIIITLCLMIGSITFAQNTNIATLKAKANNGDAEAQNNLGGAYFIGEGVEQSYSQAVYWWKKAAEQGLAAAQYNLGIAYYNGEGVEQSKSQALYWLRKACNNQDDKACNLLNKIK